jgi:hypothetical protein
LRPAAKTLLAAIGASRSTIESRRSMTSRGLMLAIGRGPQDGRMLRAISR